MLQLARSDQGTSGVGSPEITDHARRLANVARYGVVAQADYTGATAGFPAVRVDLQGGEIRTDWLPWFTPRAGGDRVWDPPEVGEVVMLLAPSGELGAAAVIPGLFSNGNANGDRAGLQRRTYGDGTVVEYDRQGHTLTIDTTASTGSVVIRTGSASIEASGTVSVEAQGQVTISGSTVHLNP
jgi:phage baseplate assembly protein V